MSSVLCSFFGVADALKESSEDGGLDLRSVKGFSLTDQRHDGSNDLKFVFGAVEEAAVETSDGRRGDVVSFVHPVEKLIQSSGEDIGNAVAVAGSRCGFLEFEILVF